MRVLQLTKFYPPVRGGMESVVAELVHGLQAAGTETDVLCAHTGRGTCHETLPGGGRLTRASSWGRWLATSVAPALLPAWWRLRGRYDVVHVHMPDPLTALALWSCPPRGALVVHWHSDVIRQRLALKLYSPLQHWLLARADRIIITSPPYAQASPWLQAWQHKLALIPPGVPDPTTNRPARGTAAVQQALAGRRLVFALGRMTHYKGFEVLIEAAARLPADVVVVIGGDGELLPRHREQVRALGLAQRVWLPGALSDDEVQAHLQQARVFCLPSVNRAEAFGVVLLEAMAHGCPIVASDIPGSGVPWVNRHGETGLNVPVADATALARGLQQVLDDPARAAELGQAARQRYQARFQATTMVSQTLALYQSLVSGGQVNSFDPLRRR